MNFRMSVLVVAVAAVMACGGTGTDETTADGAAEPVAESAPAGGAETIALTVPSMSCPLCSRSIEARLTEAGARDIRIDLDAKRVTATFDPARMTAAEVKALVEGQGFPVTESRRVEDARVERER